jgi:hypothetical protein
MYRRKPQGWLKHIDFFLLDIGSLLLSFFLSGIARHGEEASWLMSQYLGIFSFYLLTNYFLSEHNNLLKHTSHYHTPFLKCQYNLFFSNLYILSLIKNYNKRFNTILFSQY